MRREALVGTEPRAGRYPRVWRDPFVGATAAGSPSDAAALFIDVPAPADRRAGDALVLAVATIDNIGGTALPAGWTELYRLEASGQDTLICTRTATADAADDVRVTEAGAKAGAMACYRFDVPTWTAAKQNVAAVGAPAGSVYRSAARRSADSRTVVVFAGKSDPLASIHGSAAGAAVDGRLRAVVLGGRPLPDYGVVLALMDNLRAPAPADVALLLLKTGERPPAPRVITLYEATP